MIDSEPIEQRKRFRRLSSQSVTDRGRARSADQSAFNIRCLHPKMRQLFKAKCAMAGVSMEQVGAQLIQAWVGGDIDFTPEPVGHLS
jgi:hypothetical protein